VQRFLIKIQIGLSYWH